VYTHQGKIFEEGGKGFLHFIQKSFITFGSQDAKTKKKRKKPGKLPKGPVKHTRQEEGSTKMSLGTGGSGILHPRAEKGTAVRTCT